MAIHSSGQIIFRFTYIEGITLGADEKVDEVAGVASGMGIGEIGDRASEKQAAGVNGNGFTAGSLARVGARCLDEGTGNQDLAEIFLNQGRTIILS